MPSPPPPHPPVWPRAAGGRRRRRQIQQTRPFKKQDETGAAAGAAPPQAGAAPAQPREGRAGPGPAQRSSRNGSRHRHSARWAQAQGSHGVLHHGLKLERNTRLLVSACSAPRTLTTLLAPGHCSQGFTLSFSRCLPRHCTSISAPTKRVSSPKTSAATEQALGVSKAGTS